MRGLMHSILPTPLWIPLEFRKKSQEIMLCIYVANCFPTEYPGTIDQRTLQEETALYLATNKGHLDCVLSLLQAGAEPDIANKARETPLYKGKWLRS